MLAAIDRAMIIVEMKMEEISNNRSRIKRRDRDPLIKPLVRS